VREISLFSIIVAAGWPVWPLLLCSVLALALSLERLYQLRRSRVRPEALLEQTMSSTTQKWPSREDMDQLARQSGLGAVLASGLRCLNDHPRCDEETLRWQMESTGRAVAHQLERFLPALATLASVAPLLGLLGTVVGMIDIFASQTPGQGQPAQLAQGISIALYNTALGLVIAIPTLIVWRLCRTQVDQHVLQLELASEHFVRHLLALRARQARA
jgi:biopolymer transport protein ExbB